MAKVLHSTLLTSPSPEGASRLLRVLRFAQSPDHSQGRGSRLHSADAPTVGERRADGKQARYRG